MTGAPGFLEFFILEASEYVEQLDGILLGGGATGPDADALQRLARALRGTATMAKMTSFAELATGVERVGRALQEGILRWDPGLGGALVAAIDDFKTLLRSARAWSPAEDERARARAAELSRYAPPRTPAAAHESTPRSSGTPAPFLATEADNIAAGLELLTTRAGEPDTAANVLRRVRALRGVAGVKEIAPLAEVLEATEDASRGLESGKEAMTPQAKQLLENAAIYLRTLAAALREGADVGAPSQARDAFLAAQEEWASRASERELVVPIAQLFYGDGGPDVVEASPNPPTSATERFRLELVSLGEHLRQVLDSARHANDPAARARARRDLNGAIRAMQAAAESFGEHHVGKFIASHGTAADRLDAAGLGKLDDLASLLADPGAGGERLTARLREVAGGQTARRIEAAPPTEQAPAVQQPAPFASSPAATPGLAAQPPASPQRATPTAEPPGRSAAALIDSSIAALEALPSHPFGEPTPIPEDTLVPIESLLYRGRAALDRALEMRDELRLLGPSVEISALDELFDLLELARAE